MSIHRAVRDAVSRRAALGAIAALAGLATAILGIASAQAQDSIRIGELNSYSRFAAFTVPYRNGWQMALDEINAAGGVNGRMIEVISRDDGGTTGDAVRVAEELVSRDKVDFLLGTFLSNVGLAVADFANQRKTLFIAWGPLTDALTMAKGNPYTFRIRPNTWMQVGMLVDAVKDLDTKRWAIVAPNYEYGQSAAANFKTLLARVNPDAEIVVEQYPALGKIDAGATVSAIEQARPDAIFNVLFGGDLVSFVREGTTRGLFEDRTVASMLTGEPEWLLPLKAEAPVGWIATGYPWQGVTEGPHAAFIAAYREKYDETPRLGSMLGYVIMYMIRDMLLEADSTDTDAMVAALEDFSFESIVGPVTIRSIDNQGSFGAWVGRIAVEDGSGTLTDWRYYDGTDFLASEDEVEAMRGD